MKNKLKMTTAFVLCALIVLSAFMSVTVFAAGNTLSYSFTGSDSTRAGFAQGTIIASDYMAYYLDSSSKAVAYKFSDSYITSTN